MRKGEKIDIDKLIDKTIEANIESQGAKKLRNYFLELVKSDSFQREIAELRAKYGIPNDGYKNHGELEKSQPDTSIWMSGIDSICKKYHLSLGDWWEVIESYLLYNEVNFISGSIVSLNICMLVDLVEEKEDPYSEEIMEDDDLNYPIAIRISPYATKRDILDYVKKVFPLINYYQQEYADKGVKIGKIKRKKELIQTRNDFIYENRGLPRKEIKRMIKEKFNEDLDYEYVGKIISDEKKRRKKL